MPVVKFYWLFVALLVGIIAGIFIGLSFNPKLKPGGVVQTNSVQGNNPPYYPAIDVQNSPEIYQDYKHFMTDKFEFLQINNTVSATLYKRSAAVKLKSWVLQNYPFVGVSFNTRLIAELMGGYEWGPIGLYAKGNVCVTNGNDVALGIGLIWFFK